MNGLTHCLAAYVAEPKLGAHYAAARALAKTGMIDSIATMMAGRAEPVVGIVMGYYGNDADSTAADLAPVPFANKRLPAPRAACINATSCHALDFDDVALSGHTSTVLVPAILAEGHVLNASGLDALNAYVIGYEVWAELIGRDSAQYHLKGWHPTGVFGTIAAAAAVAYLHRLPVDLAQRALALAASMSSGLVSNFGTMTKPFHAGRAAACAIEAVHLAKLGLTAAPDVFEHPAGFLNAISPMNQADRTSPVTGLGTRLKILDSGISIKQYPLCYSGHRVIDAVVAIAKRENLRADQVAKVHVTLGRAQASMLRNHTPNTGLEAKFSLEFAVASALVVRQVGLTELTDSFVARADVRAVFAKVTAEISEKACPIDPAFAFADRVVITLTDGRILDSGEIRFARGHAKLPLDAAGLRAKFIDCVKSGERAAGVPETGMEALYQRLSGLETLDSLRSLY